MSKPQSTDFNTEAHRVVREATEKHEQPLPADLKAAWERWSAGVGKVDERGMALLRAAFEAGWEARGRGEASRMGRAGGLVGGRVRSDNMTAEERREQARKAAEARWNKQKRK